MDFNAILEGVVQIGFPCIMCIVIYIDMNKKIEKMQEVISENTKVIAEMKSLFEFVVNQFHGDELK